MRDALAAAPPLRRPHFAPTRGPLRGDSVVRHLNFLGTFADRRFGELDHRMEELADSLRLLRDSLTGIRERRPRPADDVHGRVE